MCGVLWSYSAQWWARRRSGAARRICGGGQCNSEVALVSTQESNLGALRSSTPRWHRYRWLSSRLFGWLLVWEVAVDSACWCVLALPDLAKPRPSPRRPLPPRFSPPFPPSAASPTRQRSPPGTALRQISVPQGTRFDSGVRSLRAPLMEGARDLLLLNRLYQAYGGARFRFDIRFHQI